MFYKVRIKDLCAPDWAASGATDAFALVEADNIRTARNLAAERIIEVEKATELELVTAGRENWPIISESSETTTDDGQQPPALPEPHAKTADTGGESRPLSTGSAPHWLPNPVSQETGD